MLLTSKTRSFAAATLLVLLFALPHAATATIVEVETDLGTIEINFYDNATPATVTNFLNYVNSGAFTDSIFHRSVPGFIIQSGGFITDINAQVSDIAANPAVINEPVYSNVRGTIAMAKLGDDPNSATSQWFINLANNAANLDEQNGGFTVFGEVTAGIDVVDAIAGLPRYDFGSAFTDLPLQNYLAADYDAGLQPDNTHLVIVTAVTVIDSTADTAAGLNPTPTTRNTTPPATGGGGGGGGSLALLSLFGLFGFATTQMLRHRRQAADAPLT
jgi:cyclophilin family peptidyl-prolyl cis-trans isomerase